GPLPAPIAASAAARQPGLATDPAYRVVPDETLAEATADHEHAVRRREAVWAYEEERADRGDPAWRPRREADNAAWTRAVWLASGLWLSLLALPGLLVPLARRL